MSEIETKPFRMPKGCSFQGGRYRELTASEVLDIQDAKDTSSRRIFLEYASRMLVEIDSEPVDRDGVLERVADWNPRTVLALQEFVTQVNGYDKESHDFFGEPAANS